MDGVQHVEADGELRAETGVDALAIAFGTAHGIYKTTPVLNLDIIDEVRNNLPDEIRDSKKIVADREQIIKGAKAESENIIQQAEERARGLVSDQEIVKRAQQRAVEILTAAQQQAKEISRSATTYCETILKNSEEVLARSVSDIKTTRMNLRSAASRGMRGQKK